MFKFETSNVAEKKLNKNFERHAVNDVSVYFESGIKHEHYTEIEARTSWYMDSLASIISKKENQIDFGGAATIFQDGDLVLKVMNNRHLTSDAHKYNLGATPLQEFNFMEHLRSFTVADVRSPAPLACIVSGETSILIMERLKAVNLQHVLNGVAELPEGFDYDKFYDSLSEYLQALHETGGVTHNDLFPRNIMIDTESSMAYLIDFGRAKYIIPGREEMHRVATKDDWDKYDSLYSELEKYRENEEVMVRSITGRHDEYVLSHYPHIHYSPKIIEQAHQLIKHGVDENDIIPLKLGKTKSIAVVRNGALVEGAMQFVYENVTYYIGKVIRAV